ncbi:LysR family transcriptional regulator [Promicromonospora sp. NPDC050880]|uniref:LysR family transcriptional regulator n=1 Tax=Promicromonospora sp. NPDC050880 TaxID=3364406 RepID=UPI0037BD534F
MPGLDLLATFLEVYRTGSLSAAAERLGVSQPAVSGQVARLEERLGGPLFVRSGRGARPTERAVALAARVGVHVDGLRSALGTGDQGPGVGGLVRIGGAAELMSERVLPALAPLVARGLQVRATLGLGDDLLAALAEGRLDVVVSSVRPRGAAVRATPLVDEEFLLVGPASLAHTVDQVRLAADPVPALAHLPLVVYAEDLPIVRRYWRSEFGRRPPNATSLVVPDLRAVLAAVAAGAGVSVLPRYLAAPALEAGRVVLLHEPQAAPLNTLYLAVARDAPPDPARAAVVDRLGEAAGRWTSL